MTRAPSTLTRILTAGADALADRLHVPAANREAFRATAVHVFESQWSAMFGGEAVRVRMWAARMPPSERAARRARILAAVAAGESPAVIAGREGVSARWVRRIASGGTLGA